MALVAAGCLGSPALAACSFGDDGPTTADRSDSPTPEVLEKTVTSNDPNGGPTPTAVPIVIEGNAPGNVYIVKPGDLLGAIAATLEVSPEALIEINGITNPDQLVVGQELLIPEREESEEDGDGENP